MLRRILFVFLCVAALTVAQDDDPNRTRGFYNGRTWNGLSLLAKGMYLAGLSDGDVVAGAVIGNRATKQAQDDLMHHSPQGFVKADFVKGMDEFYKEPANVRIPMMYAYEFCVSKFKGSPTTDLNEMVRGFRQWSVQQK